MKLPTVSIYLNKKTAKEEYGYLMLSVFFKGKPYRTPFGYKVQSKFWNAEKEVLRYGADVAPYDVDEINTELRKRKEDVLMAFKLIKDSKEELTGEIITELINGKEYGAGDFIKLFQSRIDYLRESGRTSTGYITHLEKVLNNVSKYSPTLPFNKINTDWLQKYEISLSQLEPTTRAIWMRRIHQVIKIAVKKELMTTSQFADYEFPSYENPDRPYITLDSIDRIAMMVYNYRLLDVNIDIIVIAAFFVIECYCGIRHSDWGRFNVEKLIDNHGFKVRAKKNGEYVYLHLEHWPRLSAMLDFIREEQFKYNSLDKTANKWLKVIGEMVGIKTVLSTHVGRHTAATMLAEKGYNDTEGGEILGISPGTFAIYRKMTRQGSKLAQIRHGGI